MKHGKATITVVLCY